MIYHNNIRHFDTTYCHRANNEHQRFIFSSALVSSKNERGSTRDGSEKFETFITNDFHVKCGSIFRTIFFPFIVISTSYIRFTRS